ncbi:MAG TPA: BTAD domain-containing putative transcriptional regulator, partial [Gemmatimonadales bacterium]|nr:BTAD domain-containing putative transcriptional regulator [Gemmatimonadales bacterium]
IEGKPVEAPRELLVYLLLHPTGRTKEQVGLAFWPDASTSQLRNSFHVTLHRLRKALGGPEWVTLERERYRINPELIEQFDVTVFEQAIKAGRLEEGTDLYRGDLLDGEPVGDWSLEHRDRLQRMYVDSLMKLGARFAKEQRHDRAADAYRRVLARDEMHEEALQGLMSCHAALGERPQALRVYRQFAEKLKTEFQSKPRVETLRLFERLQQS